MYVPQNEQEIIVNQIVDFWNEGNMVCFVKFSNDLYEKYGEYTADEIMLKIKNKIDNQKGVVA